MRKTIYVSSLRWVLLGLVGFLSFFGLVPPSAAADNSQLEIKNLDVQVWPEYDDPRVLNIFNGTLTNTSNTDFSGKVHFVVPKNIDIKMACELINGGQHSCQLYGLKDKGNYQILSWKSSHPIKPGENYPFWLEYYYNPLKGSPDKSMTYDYTPYYKVQNLQLTIKEPLNSSNFKLDPPSASKGKDSEGFNNDYYTFQNMAPEKTASIKISYTRSDAKPSVQPANTSGSQPNQSLPQQSTSASFWKSPITLSIVLLLLMALISYNLYSYFNSRYQPPNKRIKRITNNYRRTNDTGLGKKPNSSSGINERRKELNQMLANGEIDENTYEVLISELNS